MPASRATSAAEPPLTLPEALTAQFYAWERRGRGWDVWPYRVRLEPRLRPFFHTLPPIQPGMDDGRHPTLLSGLIDRLMGRHRPPTVADDGLEEESWAEPAEHERLVEPLVEFDISVPPTIEVDRDAAEQLLLSLAAAREPVSLEFIGTADRIVPRVACRQGDAGLVRQQVKAHFPEAVVAPAEVGLREQWTAAGSGSVVVDFGLDREFMVPLRTWRGFNTDPLVGLAGAMAELREDEVAVFQALLAAAQHPWAESVLRSVTDGEGGSFFVDAPQMVALAREKVSRSFFAVVVRVGARAATIARAWQVANAIGGGLAQFGTPGLNELVPLADDGYDRSDHEEDLLSRWSCRCGAILNSEELVSFAHLPSASVRTEKLARQVRKSKAAPVAAVGQRLILGENLHDGKAVQVGLTTSQRLRHTYIIGASGTGKSTLLLNLIVQDIAQGEGFAVLDPHGDLVDEVLGRIPEDRHKDVVLIDPSDAEYPVGFNILQAHSDLERTLLSSDLVGVFRRLSTSWGDQMTSVLGNAILAFLERPEGGTLFDLRRFLIEAEFRREVLRTVRDPEVVYYWQREFPLLSGRPQAPILTRLDAFLRPKLVRNMVAQAKDRLDFGAMMNEGKIVLAKLAQGAIGEENAYLFGALLVSRFHQMALSRQEQEAERRRPFHLYIDEFHHFVTPSMASLLSGARKFGLGLVLAHQDLRQIWNRDADVSSAVLANPCTRICFRVGDQDAAKLQDGFASFTAKDLQNLGVGEAVCRIERSDHDFNLRTSSLDAVDPAVATARRDRMIALSREAYAMRRDQVEALVRVEAPAEQAAGESPAKPHGAPRASVTGKSAPTSPARARPKSVPPSIAPTTRSAPPSPGRGGQQHKYLQELIRRWAENRGWRATVEKQVLDGMGTVDVALEKGALSVACEVSVTTTPEHELGNVQKCLAAGFGHVVVVSPERKTLAKAQALVSNGLSETHQARLRFLGPDELFAFLEEVDACTTSTENNVRGYRVRVRYKPVAGKAQDNKRQAVSRIILAAVRRLHGNRT